MPNRFRKREDPNAAFNEWLTSGKPAYIVEVKGDFRWPFLSFADAKRQALHEITVGARQVSVTRVNWDRQTRLSFHCYEGVASREDGDRETEHVLLADISVGDDKEAARALLMNLKEK